MFTRNSRIQKLERLVEIQGKTIAALNERIVQLECPHAEIRYQENVGNSFQPMMDGSYIRPIHGKAYSIFCADCGKFMGGISKEDKARAELEAAKDAYDRAIGYNGLTD